MHHRASDAPYRSELTEQMPAMLAQADYAPHPRAGEFPAIVMPPLEPMPHVPPDEPGVDADFVAYKAVQEYTTATTESANPKDIAARARCPLHLIPPVAEGEEAWVLADGAKKYGRYNWRSEKISLMNYLGAMRRHINRILDGEDIDSESGLQHLAHIRATAGIVMDAMDHGCVIDDRPSK